MTDTFSLGGNTGNSFSFGKQGAQPGASITGTVLDMAEVQRTNFDTKAPEFWDNGDPKMQYRVTLQTELRDPANQYDDGKRELYLDGRRKVNDNGTKSRLFAVLDAVRQATGSDNLQRGATLSVTWVSGMGFAGDPRNYEATYQPPAMNLGTPAQQYAAQSAPVEQYQAPAAQQGYAQQAYQAQAAAPTVDQAMQQQGQAPTFAQPAQQALPVEQAPAQQGLQLPPGVQMTPELQAALAAANGQPVPAQG